MLPDRPAPRPAKTSKALSEIDTEKPVVSTGALLVPQNCDVADESDVLAHGLCRGDVVT